MTEDALEEMESMLSQLGSDAEGSELRARLMSALLFSDMEAFKVSPDLETFDLKPLATLLDWDWWSRLISTDLPRSSKFHYFSFRLSIKDQAHFVLHKKKKKCRKEIQLLDAALSLHHEVFVLMKTIRSEWFILATTERPVGWLVVVVSGNETKKFPIETWTQRRGPRWQMDPVRGTRPPSRKQKRNRQTKRKTAAAAATTTTALSLARKRCLIS